MGGDFCSRDPRFTGHFWGSFAAFHATSLMACAITLSLDQDRLAVSLRIPSTLTDRHMPGWFLSGTTRPVRRRRESNIHASPSRVDLSWERAENSSSSVMGLRKSAKLECD